MHPHCCQGAPSLYKPEPAVLSCVRLFLSLSGSLAHAACSMAKQHVVLTCPAFAATWDRCHYLQLFVVAPNCLHDDTHARRCMWRRMRTSSQALR